MLTRTVCVSILAITSLACHAESNPCNIYAYTIGTDKTGVPIRHSPSDQSPVLQTIKSKHEGFESLTVRIAGYSSGWFLLTEVTESGAATSEFLFKGKGWLSASLLGADGAGSGTPIFASPRKQAKQVGVLHIEDGAVLRGCRGKWVEIENKSINLVGWATPGTLCTNAITNCN